MDIKDKEIFRKPDDLKKHYHPRHRLMPYKSPVVAWDSRIETRMGENAKGEPVQETITVITKENKNSRFKL